jgi:hypothetical protein
MIKGPAVRDGACPSLVIATFASRDSSTQHVESASMKAAKASCSSSGSLAVSAITFSSSLPIGAHSTLVDAAGGPCFCQLQTVNCFTLSAICCIIRSFGEASGLRSSSARGGRRAGAGLGRGRTHADAAVGAGVGGGGDDAAATDGFDGGGRDRPYAAR